MSYIQVPIMGAGTIANPYRPNFSPVDVQALNIPWSAHIPGNAAGVPLFANAVVWIPDSITLPSGLNVVVVNKATARATILSRTRGLSFDGIEGVDPRG